MSKREAPEARSKVPAVRVLSDDCTIMVGREIVDGAVTVPGTPYYVHKGEWVEVLPIHSMREFMALSQAARAVGQNEGAAGQMAQMGQAFETLCDELSKRVIAWNWTDMMGRPMPQPYRQPDVIAAVTNDELMWLMAAVKGEPVEAQKNGSMPSLAGSSGA